MTDAQVIQPLLKYLSELESGEDWDPALDIPLILNENPKKYYAVIFKNLLALSVFGVRECGKYKNSFLVEIKQKGTILRGENTTSFERDGMIFYVYRFHFRKKSKDWIFANFDKHSEF